MSRGYCVKCNRGRPKGQWKDIELIDEEIVTFNTSRGPKKFLKGKCPKCGSIVMKIIGK